MREDRKRLVRQFMKRMDEVVAEIKEAGTLRGELLTFEEAKLTFAPLSPGAYKTSGVLLYPGADAQGRRLMKTFDEVIEVDGPTVVEIGELKPRFRD